MKRMESLRGQRENSILREDVHSLFELVAEDLDEKFESYAQEVFLRGNGESRRGNPPAPSPVQHQAAYVETES